jgi:hypothetical protein
MSSKHDFQDWEDGNFDARWGTTDCANERDAAIATLRDIFNLTTEELPATAVAARVQVIARAALERHGVPPAIEDLGEPSGQWCDDDPLATDDGLVDLSAELQPEPPF